MCKHDQVIPAAPSACSSQVLCCACCAQLVVREDAIELLPGPADLETGVIRAFDDIILAGQSVDDISVKVHTFK